MAGTNVDLLREPPLANKQQLDLELKAVELLADPVVREGCHQIARDWIDAVRPSAELRERFDSEFEQVRMCGALNALNADPKNPKIHTFGRFAHKTAGVEIPGTKSAHPDPDYVYRFIPVEYESRYVIAGRAAEKGPVAFEIGVVDSDQVYQSTLSAHELAIGADGYFSISVDGDPAGERSNHLRTGPGACQIIVRDVLSDVAVQQPHSLAIERLGTSVASTVDTNLPQRCLEAIRNFIDALSAATAMLLKDKRENEFSSPALHEGGAYLVTQAYAPGFYRLADDEALVLHLTLGNAAYGVVPVTNYWGGINDFLNHIGCLGTGRATANPDGSFTFVVSLRDPGVYNWVDPDGLHEGVLCIRWVGLDPKRGQHKPTLNCQHIRLHELEQVLAPDCPRVTPGERRHQLERHRADYLRLMGDSS